MMDTNGQERTEVRSRDRETIEYLQALSADLQEHLGVDASLSIVLKALIRKLKLANITSLSQIERELNGSK